jgi:dTDP-4-amino-4,6-dideoxygalactose transaminase
VDFDEKLVTLKGVPQKPNKKTNGLIESNLIIYSSSTKEELDELGDIIDVTRFEPSSKRLNEYGIGNDVYYPTQVHKLPSFGLKFDLLETEVATKEVLSLPVHPGLSKKDLRRIVSVFNSLLSDSQRK